VIIVLVLGLSITFLGLFPINWGIDLRGGYTVSYLVEPEPEADGTATPVPEQLVGNTIRIMSKRVNKLGLKDIKILPEGRDRIKVQIPGADQAEANRIKDVLTALGRLELRIVATEAELSQQGVNLATERERRLAMEQEAAELAALGKAGPVYTGPEGDAGNLFRWYYYDDEVARERGRDGLYVKKGDEFVIRGDEIRSVSPALDQQQRLAVGFDIKSESVGKMQALTRNNLGRGLAIVLNDRVNSAPTIEDEISTGGIIRGGGINGFTRQEVDDLIATLQSGSLEIKPRLLSEDLIGPTLGEDAIRRGGIALMVGLAAVFVFMLVYYQVAGIIACLGLGMTLVIMLGVLTLLGATLTLPGIAGIVLTVGMAVDANILIFERIREEKQKGKTLLQSVKTGYEQAFRAIFDSNLTTFATAMILFSVGTEVIKGFGITLAIGIGSSMFSALFVTKTVFLFLVQKGVIQKLSMLRLIGVPKIPFLRYAGPAGIISVLFVIAGLAVFFSRGDEKYSIDFTGGEVVQVSLREPTPIQEMRQLISGIQENGVAKYPDAEVVSILVPGLEGGISTRFEISSKVDDAHALAFREDVLATLEDRLLPQGIPSIEKIPDEGAPGVPPELAGGFRLTLTLPPDVPEAEVRERFESVELDSSSLVVTPDEEATARLGGDWAVWTVMGRPTRPGLDETTLTAQIHQGFVGDQRGPLFPEPIPKSVTIGSVVAKDLKNKAIIAIFLSLVFMVFYIRIRFHEYKYGIAATLCLVHDVVVTLGFCVFFNWVGLVDVQISYAIIAVFLTIVGYSLNDTIVIFDRVRENMKRAKGDFTETVNGSINQTLSRTLLTSLTTLFVVVVLFVVNYGQKSQLEGFAFALIIGVVSGTYSTVYVASPVVVWLRAYVQRREAKKRQIASNAPAKAGSKQ
jgi:SecD/SecF fusion protein